VNKIQATGREALRKEKEATTWYEELGEARVY